MRFFPVEKIDKLVGDVRAAATRGVCDIPRFKFWQAPFDAPCPPGVECPEFDDRGWADFPAGDTWGGYDYTAWFRAFVPVPPEWRDKKLALRFLTGPRDGGNSTAETLLYVNGEPLQAIDVWHDTAWLPPELIQRHEAAGEGVHIALKAWSGVLDVPDCRRFKLARLVWLDEDAEHLAYLADTLLRAVRALSETDLRREMILGSLHEAFIEIDFARQGSDTFYGSIGAAARKLDTAVRGWQGLGEIKPRVVGIGHAHIDMAWLWRLAHSREKASRTFSTALHLMRQYPQYRFMHSSPQLYKFLKADYPEIYRRVKARIAAGQWEITGATWVEPDTNLAGGESLVRQFLLGTRWAQDEFGVDMRLLWLPDVFGYTAALPQIMAKSGVRYFLTSKLSWNQFNRFPYDTFCWRGIDGTEVLSHFVTTPEDGSLAYTYNGQMRPSDVKGIWDNYHQRDANDELLMLYGWGDGGGGPTQEMIEWATHEHSLPGLPAVELGHAEPYFERLAQRVADKDLPVWDGELYLEFHRGTYTSQAQIKRANRKAEVLYHDAEWLSALADVLTGCEAYPQAELHAGWELILLNQFHDILPGSSIREVYEDAALDFEKIEATGRRALDRAQATVLSALSGGAQGETAALVAFNPLSWERDGLVELPMTQAAGLPDALVEAGQVIEDGGLGRLLLPVRGVPSLGFAAYSAAPTAREAEIIVTPTHLESGFYHIELNERGQITSLFDKRAGREVLAPGSRGNVYQAFEDRPMKFDAWDVDLYYQDKMAEVGDLVEVAVEETGPLRGSLRLTWRWGESTITQRLMLYAGSPRIDFRTEVDWHEAQVLLKVAFPVDIRATRATYGIQFGAIERPTHWNTSWDWARFEVPAHKWADLSEGDYGVALLNDCKYGHDIHNHVMRLTLIKSAVRPDASADKGRHVFTYSLLPHAGDWRAGGVVREAYDLNFPLLPAVAGPRGDAAPTWQGMRGWMLPGSPARFSFAEVSDGNVMIETIKRSEDDPAAWIVRVYESEQSRRRGVRLTFGRRVRAAVECNLVEREEQAVEVDAQGVTFDILPFEIKTFKVWFE